MSADESEANIFGQELPQRELFHYTSAEGLKGIVSGRSLWATNIEYLNDTTEFKHGEEVMRKIVASRKRGTKGDRREFFDTLEKSPSFFKAEDVFVISLSEANDLLSQWRGYTPSNCGFCIGFDPQNLTSASWVLDKMELVRCIYEADDQNELGKTILDSCLEDWVKQREAERREANTFRNLSSIASFKIYSTFAAAAMKHCTFAEEKEWRLLGLCRDLRRFQFRPGKSSLTPYIELKWGEGTTAQNAQPIRSVTVGPCPDPELGLKSVGRLLNSCGLESVRVKSSQIPFRSW
jgi:hypothetical protein